MAKFLEPLPRSVSLLPYVDFWVQVYGVLDDGKAVIHDEQRTDKIYEVIDVPHGQGHKAKLRVTEPIIKAYRQALLDIASGAVADNKYRQRVLKLWGENASPALLTLASKRLRFQPGHADEFKKSLIRAAAVQPFIKRALREANIPLELAALPHVESFFRNDETSSANAIGIWQFTPHVGRQYMRVDGLIDERLDPRKSAIAAAKLLQHNLEITGNWPMAVTSYNHGTTGVLHAARELKTPDIGTIARHYTGENFGFASRNFYAAVLAAAEVEKNSHRFFGPLALPPSPRLSSLSAPANSSLSSLATALKTPLQKIQQNNPALSEKIQQSQLPIPAGYTLWLDCGQCKKQRQRLLELRTKNPENYRTLRIKAGDNLSAIARRNGLKTQDLVLLNKLESAHKIRIGQKIKLPWSRSKAKIQGEQLTIPPALEKPLDHPLLSAEELSTQYRLRNPDPYKPDRRFSYRAQLALYQNTHNKDLAALDAPGTYYPASNKYEVNTDSTVVLQPAETIDHLAQWLELRPLSLFLMNDLPRDAVQFIGQRVTVIFDSISKAEFERRRKQYHQRKQRLFYSEQQINGDIFHEVKSGDKLWEISQERYGVPLWLLLEYNPALDFQSLRPGDKIRLPRLEPRPHA